MSANHINPLGKTSQYPEVYTPDILFRIKRNHTNGPHKDHGIDRWTCYELSWLNEKNQPQAKIGILEIPESSPYIVESKSVKLYLNSLNFTNFKTEDALIHTIQKDISTCIETPITVRILPISELAQKPSALEGLCLDTESPSNKKTGIVQETLYSHQFRSRCPVTQQPDWASIEIVYEGKKIPETELFKLLTRDRNKEGFHETCIEALFDSILNSYQCTKLTVYGYFTRRGGIDITPIRSTHSNYAKDKRISRQ